MFGLFSSKPSASVEDLKKMIDNGAVILDVRTPQEFAEGALKGAVNIPVQVLAGQIDAVKSLNKNNETVIVYCKSGGRAGTAESILNQNNIKSINIGGYSSWASSLG